jgi:hypothetical protein
MVHGDGERVRTGRGAPREHGAPSPAIAGDSTCPRGIVARETRGLARHVPVGWGSPSGHTGGVRRPDQAEGHGPVEIPDDVEARVRTLCLGLPEVTVRTDASRVRVRSTAHAFDIRRRPFCLLVAIADRAGKSVPLLVLRAHPDDREMYLSTGHPFFAPRGRSDRIGLWLTDDTDWDEIGALVTESYRMLAPKSLIALIE